MRKFCDDIIRVKKESENSSRILICMAIIISLCSSLSSFAQQDRSFDSVYNQAATVYMFSNPDKALKIADSLQEVTQTKKQEIRVLMLQAGVYLGKPDLKKASDLARKADQLAEQSREYDWQFRTKGFIASIYQKLHFVDKGLTVIDEMDLLLPKIKDSLQRASMTVLNCQSRANFYKIEEKPDSVLYYLNRGIPYYKKLRRISEGRYFIAYSETERGRALCQLNDLEKSEEAYQNALDALATYDNPDYYLYGHIYTGMGNLVFKKDKDTVLAKDYYRKAEKFTKSNKVSNLDLFLAEELKKFYGEINNIQKYKFYAHKKDSLQAISDKERAQLAANFFDEKRADLTDAESKKRYYYISIILGVVVLFLLLNYVRNNRKLSFYAYPPQSVVDGIIAQGVFAGIEAAKDSSSIIISTETEQAILEKLDEFEEKQIFLNNSMNLSTVAAFCKTNSRYVSESLKKHRKVDFQTYINQLRINYILEKLELKKYRNYKISYLAQEAGFSSHSRFSAVFKKVKGVAPSVFIKELKKESKS